MTELQFLLDLLLNHKIPKGTKQAITERIKVVETNIIPPPRTMVQSTRMPPPDMTEAGVQATPPPIRTQGIVGGEVSTGPGTRGPRKF